MNKNRKLIEFWTKYRVPFVYDDTLSLYQLVLKVIKHLNLIIGDQNELKKAISEFIEAFEYESQEVIKQILQEWRDEGYLGEIVEEALLSFEGKLDEKANKEDLQSFRDITDINISEFLYVNNDVKSECILIEIPSKYKLKYSPSDPKDPKNNLKTASEFNEIVEASVVINASQGGVNGYRSYMVSDGNIYQDFVESGFTHISPLAFNDNGDYKIIKHTDNIGDVVGEGWINVIPGFEPLIVNGKNTTFTHNGLKSRHPRQVIGKDTSGNFFILTVKGRTGESDGLNGYDIQTLLRSKINVDMAYMLDGGGSTQTLVYGVNLADKLDDNFKTERKRADFIYFVNEQMEKKDMYEKNKQKVLNLMNKRLLDVWGYVESDKYKANVHLYGSDQKVTGVVRKNNGVNKTKLNLTDNGFELYDYNEGRNTFKFDGGLSMNNKKLINMYEVPSWWSGDDANDITGGFYYCDRNVKNLPDNAAWWILAFKQSDSGYYTAQVAFPLGKGRKIMFRNKEGSSWSAWE